MGDTMNCPACQGSGMTGASSCARCRGTGSVRVPDAGLVPEAAATAGDVTPEARRVVEQELEQAFETPRLKLKGRQVKLSAGPRRGRGLGFKR